MTDALVKLFTVAGLIYVFHAEIKNFSEMYRKYKIEEEIDNQPVKKLFK